MSDRPTSRESENEQQKSGAPPRSATEPAGSAGSQQSAKTRTDPGSGETTQAGHAPNQSAAEEGPPAAHEDKRARPD